MKTRRPQSAFATHALVFAIAALSFGGAVGLGRVWICHQISLSANEARSNEAKLVAIERQIAENDAVLAFEQDAARLKQRNSELHLGLLPPADGQVHLVREDPVQQLASKRRRGLYDDAPVSAAIKFPRLALALGR